MKNKNHNNDSIENFILSHNVISREEFDKVKQLQGDSGDSFIVSLSKVKTVKLENVLNTVSNFYRTPILQQNQWPEEILFTDQLSLEFLRQNKICPIVETNSGVVLAIADPGDNYAIDAVKLALQKPILPYLVALDDIEVLLSRSKYTKNTSKDWVDESSEPEQSDDINHLKDIALDAPVVRFVNEMLLEAVRLRATDIHIEPFQKRLIIRMRIDGMLQEIEAPPVNMAKAVISRIKILSGLDIAERRLPQDGRSRLKIENEQLDLRIATAPTIYGEAVAIRLLTNVRRNLDFTKLGFSDVDTNKILKQISYPHGMFIITGPTGSGKTTTLAAGLTQLNQSHKKILTVEDPIEYELEGVNQTAVKASIGLTFATALRSFLRHDPDIIMVGEMRDTETAGIGVHAALTGHLVMTTLHTNSAAGAIPRLIDMGVDAFLLSSSLRCIVGQRLVRKLCDHCKQQYTGVLDQDLTKGDPNWSQPQMLYRPVGCERCNNTGYSDRIIISEVLEVNENIQQLIKPGVSSSEIELRARQLGMHTMLEDGLQKCIQGITTQEEVRRVALNA